MATHPSLELLADSQYVPSWIEIAQLHGSIEKEDETLGHLDTEIARMAAALADLQNARDALQNARDVKAAAVSPLRRFPVELLSHVFKFALPSATFVMASCNSAPLSLLAVCKSWKAVTETTPELWQSIGLSWPQHCRQECLAGIQRWLIKSRTRPLDVQLDLASGYTNMDELELEAFDMLDAENALLDILTHTSTRWRNVSMNIEVPLANRLLSTENLLLTQLVFLRINSSTVRRIAQPIPISITSPSLARAELVGIMTFDESRLRKLLSHKLKTIECATIRMVDCFAILRLCPTVQECSFDSIYGSARPVGIILHQELSSLDITTTDIGHVISLLEHLKAPSLKKIGLNLHLEKVPVSITQIILPLLSTFSSSLEHLDLFAFALDDGEQFYLDLCNQLPRLRTLQIEERRSVLAPQAGLDILNSRRIGHP